MTPLITPAELAELLESDRPPLVLDARYLGPAATQTGEGDFLSRHIPGSFWVDVDDDLAAHLRRADIVVAAAGVPHLIKPEDVKPGAAVLDVGVSRDANGKIVGDVHPGVAEVAGWLSPNPGGVGPMTRAQLLVNVVEAAERAAGVAR